MTQRFLATGKMSMNIYQHSDVERSQNFLEEDSSNVNPEAVRGGETVPVLDSRDSLLS
jgi:hypothetical protein